MTDAACARAGGCRHWRVPRMFGDPTADPRLGAGAGPAGVGASEVRVQGLVTVRFRYCLRAGTSAGELCCHHPCVLARPGSGPLTEEAWGACSVVDFLSPFTTKGRGMETVQSCSRVTDGRLWLSSARSQDKWELKLFPFLIPSAPLTAEPPATILSVPRVGGALRPRRRLFLLRPSLCFLISVSRTHGLMDYYCVQWFITQ